MMETFWHLKKQLPNIEQCIAFKKIHTRVLITIA